MRTYARLRLRWSGRRLMIENNGILVFLSVFDVHRRLYTYRDAILSLKVYVVIFYYT